MQRRGDAEQERLKVRSDTADEIDPEYLVSRRRLRSASPRSLRLKALQTIDNVPVPHLDRPRTDGGGLRVVRDHDDRLLKFFVQFAEHIKHDLRIFRIEISGRLIGQDDRRAVDHRTCQSATRCCSPPDSSSGLWCILSSSLSSRKTSDGCRNFRRHCRNGSFRQASNCRRP